MAKDPDTAYDFVEPFIEHQGEKRGFWLRKPRKIGEKLLIAGAAGPIPDSRGNRAVLRLDFRGAFGTGGHGSTEGCLVALEKFLRGGESVLDVGTGTGILAIAACKLGAGTVTAVDIDGAACAETRSNLARNGLEGRVDVREGGVQSVEGPFGIIVANLRTPVLASLMEDLVKRAGSHGIAIFSGILERELPSFLSFLGPHPLTPAETYRIHGWVTLVVRHRGHFLARSSSGNPNSAQK
jgi:ribosomal protein L11 methyltransferase